MAVLRWRRWLGDGRVTKKDWRRGSAAAATVTAAAAQWRAAAVAMAATAVGLPWPYVSSHSNDG